MTYSIAQKLANKRNEAYSTKISVIRRKIRINLVMIYVISFETGGAKET